MGGLFGILGMIIGVPVFAVVIHILNDYTMNALRKKGLETSLTDYHVGNVDEIDASHNKKATVKKLIKKSKKSKTLKNNNHKEK